MPFDSVRACRYNVSSIEPRSQPLLTWSFDGWNIILIVLTPRRKVRGEATLHSVNFHGANGATVVYPIVQWCDHCIKAAGNTGSKNEERHGLTLHLRGGTGSPYIRGGTESTVFDSVFRWPEHPLKTRGQPAEMSPYVYRRKYRRQERYAATPVYAPRIFTEPTGQQ